VQLVPFPYLPVQVPLRQKLLTQSVSAVHVDGLHAVPEAQTTPPGQAAAAGCAQAPAPLQLPLGVISPLPQETVPQVTFEVAKRQPPFPSQVPSCPQAVESTEQKPPDEPPAATGLQRPLAQVMQVPAQVVAQQIPEMQLPCVHWLLLLQVEPSDSVAAQVMPDVQ